MLTASVPQLPLYKFLTAERRSPNGTGRWTVNRWRSVRGELVACSNGLHATTADNLLPFFDKQLWRVEIVDEYLWHTDSMGRKLVARRMRIVERIESWNGRTARLFAADCAERVLPLFEARSPGDTRPREAIAVVRRFANGDATRDELAAARDAAEAAAGVAAWDAAEAAAGAVAWAAARVGSGEGGREAAWAAERDWQAQHLAELLGMPLDAGVTP